MNTLTIATAAFQDLGEEGAGCGLLDWLVMSCNKAWVVRFQKGDQGIHGYLAGVTMTCPSKKIRSPVTPYKSSRQT